MRTTPIFHGPNACVPVNLENDQNGALPCRPRCHGNVERCERVVQEALGAT